jgi:glutaminyl-peptide cyclotransferase
MLSSRFKVLSCAALVLALSVACNGSTPPEFSADSAWTFLLAQCDFGPRVPGTPEHEKTVQYLASTLKTQGATVQFQRFEIDDPYGDRKLPLTNIIGSFFPDRRERVILTAHYDTRPRADQETEDSLRALPILGANDGASGVAVLLEIGRLIAGDPPDRVGVDIVFFDGEDYGKESDLTNYLLGSKYFVANLGSYRPSCGILLDMVGGENCRIRQEANSMVGAPELVTDLFARAARLELDVFVPERGDPIYDDHIPFLRAGIPMVDLIGIPYEHWHTLGDTPEACSPETLRQVGTLLLDFLYDYPF